MLRRLIERLKRPPENADSLDLRLLPSLLRKKDPTILDIGCNSGDETEQFLRLFPKATIYCFEPDPRARASFLNRIGEGRVELFDIAIGAVDGTIDFYQSGGTPPAKYGREVWDLSGSIRKPKNHYELAPWVTFDSVLEVTVNRLDTWASTHNVSRVDFIWADVQGAEVDLLRGGPNTLKNTRFLYTEYHDHELYEGQATLQELLEIIPDFETVRRYPGDVLLRNTKIWA
jgi:FkbM family methyltransferase